jgi:hypothetical protein
MEGQSECGRIYMAQHLLGTAIFMVQYFLGTAICAGKQYAGN